MTRRSFAVECDRLLDAEVADNDHVVQVLAKSVLTVAVAAGMPDTY